MGLFDCSVKLGSIEKEHRILVCVVIIFYVFVSDSNQTLQANKLEKYGRCTLSHLRDESNVHKYGLSDKNQV